MNNKIALESLVMDLKRVALGYQRGSFKMARRFYQEALARKEEIDPLTLRPYARNLLDKIMTLQNNKDDILAEDALMLSTLLENYIRTYPL